MSLLYLVGILTSDREVLEIVSKIPIAGTPDLLQRQCFQYPRYELEFIEEELQSLLNKKVISKPKNWIKGICFPNICKG